MSPTPKVSERQRWEQKTAFPIIADAIRRLHHPDVDNFVSKREIVPLLLHEPHSRTLIDAAYKRTGREWSVEQYTGNMVQWFSHKWTVGDPKWLSLFNQFERNDKKIDGCWAYKPIAVGAINVFPDELEDEEIETLPEGATTRRLVNAYERNPLARQKCIEKYGAKCYVCGFSFGATYGQIVDGFIHVHHLRQLSKVGENYNVDPIADLRPVCPNCHAVIHHRDPAYSIEEVESFLLNHGKRK
jgi:predicted HNH restriction endonuclease